MDKTNTVLAQPSPVEETDYPSAQPDPQAPTQAENANAVTESTGEKALDRWFLEQRGAKRVPKKLELPNELLVTNGGPLKMTGNITMIDEEGTVSHANHLSLCRCGASNNKPLCDDQHLEVEFFDSGTLQRVSDWMPVSRPQTITVTCVKDGPLKFRGYLRIFNKKGQECITMNGALCRCGKSSNKPFCDSKNGCAGC